MPQCIVKGCSSGSRKSRSTGIKVHLFSVPKDDGIRQKWQDAVQRSDLVLSTKHHVCEKHFLSKEIRWRKVLTDSLGRILGVSAKYAIPRLEPGSVPSIFEWTQQIQPIDVSSPESSGDTDAAHATVESVSVEMLEVSQPSILPEQSELPEKPETPEPLEPVDSFTSANVYMNEVVNETTKSIDTVSADEALSTATASLLVEQHATRLNLASIENSGIKLPDTWNMHNMVLYGSHTTIVLCFVKFVPTKTSDGKIVLNSREVIFSENEIGDICCQINVAGCSLDKAAIGFLQNGQQISSLEDIRNVLLNVNDIQLCAGYAVQSPNNVADALLSYKDSTGTWRHNKCPLVTDRKSCSFCTRMRKTISQRQNRLEKRQNSQIVRILSTTQEREAIELLRKKTRNALKGKRRALKTVADCKLKLKKQEEEIGRMSIQKVEELLVDDRISANECTVIKEIIHAARCKNKNGRRYSEDWMLLCRLLHMQSAKAYRFLQQYNILPLPNVRTISN